MTDRNETLADIVAEMRERADFRALYPDEIIEWADRIEAAAKRQPVTICNGLSNAAKLREAASAMEDFLTRHQPNGFLRDAMEPGKGPDEVWAEFCEIDVRLEKALAAPPRNCDRFATVGAAHKAWRATDQERDFARWLFDAAQEGGGHDVAMVHHRGLGDAREGRGVA